MNESTGRAAHLLELLNAIHETNRFIPIIVEGKRDRAALRRLGISGEVLLLHSGKSVYDFCEDILGIHDRFIILLDWDRRGETLYRKVTSHLRGHYEEFTLFRELLKQLLDADIKEVEDLPGLLKRLLKDGDATVPYTASLQTWKKGSTSP